MQLDRRNFVKYAALSGTGILIHPLTSCGNKREAAGFLSNIGVCTDYSNYTLLKEAGYSYIEESVQNFLVPLDHESVFEEKLAQMRSSKLLIPACNNFIPAKLKSVGPDAVHDEILKYVDTAFRRTEIAGVKTIVFGSGGSRKIPEGFPAVEARDQFISLCKKIAPAAEKYNLTVVLEPLNKAECNIANSVAEGGEIVKIVSHRNFMLLADVFHMLREDENPDNIVKYGDLIRHTHIAENIGREAPGMNGEDFTPYFKALKEIGYEGLMSVECNWRDMPHQAAPALLELRRQIDLIGVV